MACSTSGGSDTFSVLRLCLLAWIEQVGVLAGGDKLHLLGLAHDELRAVLDEVEQAHGTFFSVGGGKAAGTMKPVWLAA